MSTRHTIEGRLTHGAFRDVSTNMQIEVLGCEAALFEWAESFDSKVGSTLAIFPGANIADQTRTGNV